MDETRRRISMVQVMTSVLASAVEIDDVLRIVGEHGAIFGSDVGVLGVVRGDVLELRQEWGFQPHELAPFRVIPLVASTPPTDCIRTGAPVVLPNLAAVRERYPHLARPDLGEQAFISLPLRTDVDVIGTISLRLAQGTALGTDQIDHLLMITQQIALALARAKLYDEVRTQREFERKLMAMLSHDLRTPLSAIVMASALLPRDQPLAAGLIERIERSANRMTELISSMLEMRAVKQEPRDGERNDVDLALADQLAELRSAFPSRTLVFEPGLGGTRLGIDPARASQITANLARNALEHGDPSQPVTVSTRLDQHTLVLDVHNLGAAIPAEVQRTIFDPYSRGEKRGRGFGLGLYIVKELVDRMGGTVGLTSDATGTTFSVRVPFT